MKRRRWITYPNAVWCDVHCTHHAPNRDPYGYGDEVPECGPEDWRALAILATRDEEF